MSQEPGRGADQYIDKAKDYAKDNPDQTRSMIDKAEDFVDARTGGKFSGMVDKAGDFLEGQLGLPTNTTDPTPSEPTQPAPPSEPSQPPATPDSGDPLPGDGVTPTTPTTPTTPDDGTIQVDGGLIDDAKKG